MNILFDFTKKILAPHETITVPVILNTTNEAVNGIEGTLTYPKELFQLKEIKDGNSSINFWVQKPQLASDGVIHFSGITPGGLSGQQEFLFALVFETTTGDTTGSLVSDVRVFKNDGNGTVVAIPAARLDLTLQSSLVAPIVDSASNDTTAPESFVPLIGNDSSIFDGALFVAFSTQDKGTGIDHYEVKEGIFGKYRTTESPYQLLDQSRHHLIYIKAVDRSGNKKIESVSSGSMTGMYVFWIMFAILILIILIGVAYKKVWRK